MSKGSLFTDVSIHDNFDYESTKRAFHQEVGYVLIKCNYDNKIVMSKDRIKCLLSCFEVTNRCNKKKIDVKFNIANENGSNILSTIVWSDKEPFRIISLKQLLSIEEIFDLMTELHIREPQLALEEFIDKLSNCNILPCFIRNNTCEPLTLKEYLEKLFNSNIFPGLIKQLWKVCNCCQDGIKRPIGLLLDPWFRVVGEMGIVKIKYSIHDVCRILVYVERNTNFVILRPLKTDQVEEVANELLSIFCDFGPPQHLDCKKRSFFQRVLIILQSLPLTFTMPKIYISCKEHKITIMEKKVKHMINDWKGKSSSSNWIIGAHIIQWRLNTNRVVDTYIKSKTVCGPSESPYHAMFGILPHNDQIQLNDDKPEPEVNNFLICSQCQDQVYKVYECHFCKAICHFMCCQRVVQETDGLPILYNRCHSCGINMSEELVLGV